MSRLPTEMDFSLLLPALFEAQTDTIVDFPKAELCPEKSNPFLSHPDFPSFKILPRLYAPEVSILTDFERESNSR